MFGATRRWFRRNRTPIAIGLGVVGAGYVVTHYVLNKLNDARERMSSDRIAKENLRRRFEQNQEDCTFTVLALLPTATTNILEAMNTEKITYEIQQLKGSVAKTRNVGSVSPPSLSETNATDDDGRSIISVSVQSEAGIHASQISVPSPLATVDGGPQEGAPAQPQKARKTKRQLWDDLTISSITRAYTLLYTLGLLAMLTRIQLNLLGRRSYLSSVVSLATGGAQATISLENNDDDSPEQAYGSDFDVNRKYLTFSWWLLNRGWVDVMQRVEQAVRQVFGQLSPRDSITLSTFSELTSDVRRLVEGSVPGSAASGTRWLPILLPPPNMEDFVLRESGILDEAASSTSSVSPPASPSSAASLRRLLDETSDLVESPTFSQVLTQILDQGFSMLLDKKLTAGAFDAAPPTTGPAASIDLRESHISRAVLLPKILSVLARQAHVIGDGMPNEYLQAMEAVRDLEGFAAVVYSSNWQAEIARDEEVEARSGGASRQKPAYGTQQDSEALLRQSQTSVGAESSLVMVDPQVSFDSAWERAFEQKGSTE
ncbi:peroxin-3 [Lasiosphaeria miniovina]|uniref:Peroxin-3 n=1 Tax=Lasiosphaeria miniovina TaxID=1954250 RepID=A0AA40E0Z0_9PEZI|nr:peroxin-3 [Lasiosphaeria miniovina]KAK0722975.1 peroxin-3 [Lasiosphaeria miniovina]